MKVEHDADGTSSTDGQMAFAYNREYSCTYLCLNRPSLEVNLVEDG